MKVHTDFSQLLLLVHVLPLLIHKMPLEYLQNKALVYEIFLPVSSAEGLFDILLVTAYRNFA